MKTSTLIAVAVFAVLGLAYFATREPQVTVGVHKLTFAPLSADAITRVELNGLVLRAQDGAWTVASASVPEKQFAADENLVKALRESLAGLKAEDFVTEKPEKHAELELDASKGLSVKASTSAGVVRDVVLGKTSKSGGAYLREAQRNEVFVTTGALPVEARRTLSQWRKKSVVALKTDEVVKVQLAPAAGTPFTLQSDAGAWKLVETQPSDYRFDAAAALRLVGQLATLTAQDFAEGEPTEPVTHTLIAELKEGRTLTVRAYGKRSDGLRPVRVEGDPQTYLVADWQAEQVFKDLDGLRDLRLLRFEPGQVQRLTITATGQKTVVAKDGESWKVVEPKTLPSGFDFDPQQVTSVLLRLSNLRATRVVRDVPDAKANLRPMVELTLAGASPLTLRFGSETSAPGTLYARGDDGLTYAVSASEKTTLEGGLQLFKRPPPRPNFGGAQGLDQLPPEIRAQIEAQLRQRN
jgi:hypothetical protein